MNISNVNFSFDLVDLKNIDRNEKCFTNNASKRKTPTVYEWTLVIMECVHKQL